MGSIDQDPTLPGGVGDASCYWEGERMREGSGQTGIRKAVAQQHKYRETNKKCWNELLLDASVTNRLMRQDAASTISAYVLPYPNGLLSPGVWQQLVATRNQVTQELGLKTPIPIVGLNVMNA